MELWPGCTVLWCNNRRVQLHATSHCNQTWCLVPCCAVTALKHCDHRHGGLQVYAMPVYDMIEYQLVKRHVPNAGVCYACI